MSKRQKPSFLPAGPAPPHPQPSHYGRPVEARTKSHGLPKESADGLRRRAEFSIHDWRIEPAGPLTRAVPEQVEQIIRNAVEVIADTRNLYHRSLYAATYLTRIEIIAGGPRELFVKVYDPPRGLGALKERFRGGRASNVIRMTALLERHGFHTAQLVLAGIHERDRRTMLVSARAEGISLAELLQSRGGSTVRRRALIRALGAEIARLHRCGFVHGDLTPYNIFVAGQEPPRFIFLDQDRTRLAFFAGRRYRQLRNLVQLGRFGLPGVSNTDRLRFFYAYTAGLTPQRKRVVLRRLAAMLARRQRKDARQHSLEA